jgi:hypothetical protein
VDRAVTSIISYCYDWSFIAHTPVLASDIPVFRAIAGDRITRLSTIDGEGWLKAIVSIADNGSGEAARRQPDTDAAPTLASYFEDVDAFLRTL